MFPLLHDAGNSLSVSVILKMNHWCVSVCVRTYKLGKWQVKQQKKSSNKWNCVVCNQKQSVRKVFAQSSMARDVRKFVQASNMSRQMSDQKHLEVETLEIQERPKRNDWNEYVDVDDKSGSPHPQGNNDGAELLVVTEMPKLLLKKKQKVMDCSRNGYGSEKMLKPIFSGTRNGKRRLDENYEDARLEKVCDDVSNEEDLDLDLDYATKWNLFKAEIQDSNRNKMEGTFIQKKPVKRPISKWSAYVTRESENNDETEAPMAQASHRVTSKGPLPKWSNFINKKEEKKEEDDDVNALEKLMNDERVEDDVHPDFM
ncbi:hypothetical protein STAS_33133 [Striga asiatica]|uniref:MRN complex-interacting protein N-terminal domain-containing protein n=1 Tax=Striga asiatica TaxID=4170 RepID=A0A5A7RET7_STRAF|nr:hypothetical protein STAS_33133 [Striga asiatica]